MYTFKDKSNLIFNLTSERWKHIVERHPEMKKHFSNLEIVLREPDIICRSSRVYDTVLYYKKFENLSLNEINFSNVYIVVIVDIFKNIIKTAYPARKIIKGEIIWQRTMTD